MLEIVENVNFSTDSLGSYDVVALRHVSSLVDLACMVDLGLYGDSLIFEAGAADAISIFSVILIVAGILRRFERDFNLSNIIQCESLLS